MLRKVKYTLILKKIKQSFKTRNRIQKIGKKHAIM